MLVSVLYAAARLLEGFGRIRDDDWLVIRLERHRSDYRQSFMGPLYVCTAIIIVVRIHHATRHLFVYRPYIECQFDVNSLTAACRALCLKCVWCVSLRCLQ